MKAFSSVDEILDFAIGEEEEAADFYTGLAERAKRPWMRQIFLDFAGEEQGHKRKLLGIKQDGSLLSTAGKVTDLKMADYLTDVEPSSDLEYEEALILAMKKEKAAFKLYTDLAATTDNETLRETLLGLAQEEAKHKLRFEIEYDDLMTEN